MMYCRVWFWTYGWTGAEIASYRSILSLCSAHPEVCELLYAAEGLRVQSWQHVYHQPPSLSALSIPLLPALPECQGEIVILAFRLCAQVLECARMSIVLISLPFGLKGKAQFNLRILHNAALKSVTNKHDSGMRN